MDVRRAFVVGIVCAISVACLCAAQADQDLRPEWSVGQYEVSPRMLAVTVSPSAPAELTIQDAVGTALQRNIGFRGTIQSLLSDRSALYVAFQRWQLFLTGSATRTRNDAAATDTSVGASFAYSGLTGADISVAAELARLDSDERRETLTASLRQPLLANSFKASAAYEQVRLARNTYRASLLSYFVDRQSLIVSVLSAYYGAVQQSQLVGIQESSVSLAEVAVRDAQLRLEAGLIAEIDLTRAQLRLAESQTSLVAARQQEQDALDNLLLLTGLQVGGHPALVSNVTFKPVQLDVEAAVAEALERRPELRLSDLSIENRQAVLRISRSRSLPTFDLVGALQRTSNELTQRSWNIGLEASVPVASRALTEAVRQANWALLVAQQQQENLRQQVSFDVRSQVRAALAAQMNVEIATKGLEVAQRSLQIAGRMVEEGLATNRDLLDAQNQLTLNGTSLVTSKISHYLATVRLRQSMGIDISSDLPTERLGTPPASGTGAGQQAPPTGAGGAGA